jgi:hypothetical protein
MSGETKGDFVTNDGKVVVLKDTIPNQLYKPKSDDLSLFTFHKTINQSLKKSS